MLKSNTTKELLRQKKYNIKDKFSYERQKALLIAMDIILTGVSPEDIVEHLTDRKNTTRNITEKRRYKQDIDFIKSEMKWQIHGLADIGIRYTQTSMKCGTKPIIPEQDRCALSVMNPLGDVKKIQSGQKKENRCVKRVPIRIQKLSILNEKRYGLTESLIWYYSHIRFGDMNDRR